MASEYGVDGISIGRSPTQSERPTVMSPDSSASAACGACSTPARPSTSAAPPAGAASSAPAAVSARVEPSSPAAPPARKGFLRRWGRPSFAILCVLFGLESIAANVVHPVEPAFYIALGLPDWIFGAAFAAMAFGLFAFSPFWGVISDRLGRVPTLAVTMLLYGLAQLAFLVSTTVPTILLARLAAGAFCSGCGVAAMAFVADISDAGACGRRMSIFAAVQSFCTALGYLVGGIVGQDDPGRSFVLQFFILAAVALGAVVLLVDGQGFHRSDRRLTLASANPLAAFADTRAILSPWMVAFLSATTLACLASAAFDNSFNYYLRDQFGFPTTYNGYIYAAVGVLGLVANVTIGLRLQRSRDTEGPLSVVLVCAAAVLGSTLLAANMPLYLGLNMLFYVFNSLYLPLMQALAIEGDPDGHGRVSGLFQSVKSLGMVVGALVAGFVYEADPRVPFVMAAASFLLAACCAVAARRIARTRGRRRRA